MTLLDPVADFARFRRGAIDADDLETVAREIDPAVGSRGRLLVLLILGIAAFVAGLVVFAMTARGSALPDLSKVLENPVTLVPALSGLAILPAIFAQQKRARRRRTLAVLLRHRLCPHCGYGLRGVPADRADGATVCPECGAAWRLGDKQPPR